jgi:hypothetical protein
MDMVALARENFFQLFGSLVSFTPVNTNVCLDFPAATAAATGPRTSKPTPAAGQLEL